MKDSTRVNHPPAVAVPADNAPLVAPIYQSVKFEFESVAETERLLRGERDGFFYQRTSNPTLRQLEQTLAALQQRAGCIVCASGVAATAGVLASLTRSGDHVLCFLEMYGPTRVQVRRWLAKYGVRHTLLSIDDRAGIEQVLQGTPTRLVVFETPTNPMNKLVDLEWLCGVARAHGALTVLDNTLAGPHQQGEFPVDVYTHSLTKHVSGHGDVMGGAVMASAELIRQLRPDFSLIGATLDPHAAWLLQRGLKTFPLRFREQSAAALRVAEFLAQHAAVARVHYLGLAGHPQHALAARQMSAFGPAISFEVRGGAEAGRRVADALRLFAIAASFGSTESLVLPPQLLGARDLGSEQAHQSGLEAGTMRISIGLEAVDELIADLDQALAAAGA